MLETSKIETCLAAKSLRMCYVLVKPMESVTCEEILAKLLILRYGGRGGGTSLSDANVKDLPRKRFFGSGSQNRRTVAQNDTGTLAKSERRKANSSFR